MSVRKLNPYYPAFLNLAGRKCVVVGGGQVALRKVRALLQCGAAVTVVSPAVCAGLKELAADDRIAVLPRAYRPGDLAVAYMALSATGNECANAEVAAEAHKRGVLVNIADDPARSSFIVPSTVSRGYLTVAVSTGGKSPALARRIRTELEKDLGPEYARLVDLIGEIRQELSGHGIDVDGERWQQALDLNTLLKLLGQGKRKEAKAFVVDSLKGSDRKRRIS
jgi:precorrin-2 dehydrogenase / sirohydrochlorin ferrochelatase